MLCCRYCRVCTGIYLPGEFWDKTKKWRIPLWWHSLRKVSEYGVFCVPYFPVFSPNMGKYGSEKTLYLDTFHAVALKLSYFTDCFLGFYRITYSYFYVRLSLCKKKAGSKLFHIIFNCLGNGPEKFIRRRFMVTVKLGIFLCIETQYGLVIHKSSRKQSNQHELTTS